MNQSDILKQEISNNRMISESIGLIQKSKEIQLNVQINEVQNIIYQEQFTEEEKVIKIREIFGLIKIKDLDELQLIFNKNEFSFIQLQIQNCSTEIERVLLDIVEFVANSGIYFEYTNMFFYKIQGSNLLKIIRNLIKTKFDMYEKENNIISYSQDIEQLVRIYLMIMRYKVIEQEMINICSRVIEKNIIELLNRIKSLENQNDRQNTNEINNDELEKCLERIKIIIQAVGQFRDIYGHIPDQILKIVQQNVTALIHLNCEEELKCRLHINIPNPQCIHELKFAVFNTISDFLYCSRDFLKSIAGNRNILLHITFPTVQFATTIQQNKKTDQKEQLQQSFNSLSTITSSMELLKYLICNNDNLKWISDIPNFLQSLLQLHNYKLNTHISNEKDKFASQLGRMSQDCLSRICYQNQSLRNQLVTLGYVRILIIYISTASGIGVDNNNEIMNKLSTLRYLFTDFDNFRDYKMLKRQDTEHFHWSMEQIEEEGGIEEIETHLINKGNGSDNNIRLNTRRTKYDFLYIFINRANPIPQWY